MKGKQIKQHLKLLRQVLGPMTWRQRLEHILFVYKEYLLLGLFLILILACVLSIALTPKKDTAFGGVVINLDYGHEGKTQLTDQFLAHIGADIKTQDAELLHSTFYPMQSTQQIDANYNESMALIARINAGNLDYAIMDSISMEYYIQQDLFMDLRMLLTEDELVLWREKMVYMHDEETDESWPIAIKITQLPFVQQFFLFDGEVYIAFPGNTGRMDACKAFWEFISTWTTE